MLRIHLTQAAFQEQTLLFKGIKIRITLRYNSNGQFWAMDVYEPERKRQICQGLSVVCGVPMLWRTTQDYYLWCEDESGANLDPMTSDDLGTRCFLYIGDKLV